MAQTALLPVTLTCSTDLRFIDLIQVVGAEFLKHLNFSQEDGEQLWLAIQEGIANAMRHGNALDKGKSVRVSFTPLADRFEIRIQDQGKGVVLEQIPDPNLPENLLKPGGRGVFFMKQVMDDVRMEQTPEGATLILVKARGKRETTH
ncbi:MAG TPA: ATP-binding protein [Holophagaceae bacterium]|nr:ATP-binding protein [Holophagaceae bacterium]